MLQSNESTYEVSKFLNELSSIDQYISVKTIFFIDIMLCMDILKISYLADDLSKNSGILYRSSSDWSLDVNTVSDRSSKLWFYLKRGILQENSSKMLVSQSNGSLCPYSLRLSLVYTFSIYGQNFSLKSS